jgi:GAF domain-containing protein
MNWITSVKSFFDGRIAALPAVEYRKARLLSLSLGITLFFSVAYIGVTLITDFLVARYAMVVCALAMIALLFLLKHSNWKTIAQLFLGVVWWLTTLLVYFSDGATSQMLSWFVLTTLLALMILPREKQWVWIGVSSVTVLLFLVAPPARSAWVYVSPWPEFYNVTLVVGLILIVYWVANTFHHQQTRLLGFSENENDALRAAEEELRQSLEELSATQDAMEESNMLVAKRQKKTEEYLNDLMELATCQGILIGNKQMAYRDILAVTVRALQTSRVSVWKYKAEEKCIECVGLMSKEEGFTTSGAKLLQTQYAPYFGAVLAEKVIVATDARKHDATACFLESYLKPLEIYSMLDVPYFDNGKFQGVICCEHQFGQREWDQEDVLFVKSVADLVGMANSSAQRKQNEQEIVLQREKILDQNKQLVSYAEEIKVINYSLESRVEQRTRELHEQNKKLTEYAFVNAHLLRGPLSRILGLVEIIQQPQTTKEELITYIELLHKSTKELDGVVHKITDILHEGRNLDRNSLRE